MSSYDYLIMYADVIFYYYYHFPLHMYYFTQVLLITRGQVAYWGPLTEAMPYFERLGFRCPTEYSEAEFLASVVERPADFLAGVVVLCQTK